MSHKILLYISEYVLCLVLEKYFHAYPFNSFRVLFIMLMLTLFTYT
jgi:hypothetical protein